MKYFQFIFAGFFLALATLSLISFRALFINNSISCDCNGVGITLPIRDDQVRQPNVTLGVLYNVYKGEDFLALIVFQKWYKGEESPKYYDQAEFKKKSLPFLVLRNICGATFITKKYLITAATCFANIGQKILDEKDPNKRINIWRNLGHGMFSVAAKLNRTVITNMMKPDRLMKIKNFIPHPQLKLKKLDKNENFDNSIESIMFFDYNIGIVELYDDKLDFQLVPPCLEHRHHPNENHYKFVYIFGVGDAYQDADLDFKNDKYDPKSGLAFYRMKFSSPFFQFSKLTLFKEFFSSTKHCSEEMNHICADLSNYNVSGDIYLENDVLRERAFEGPIVVQNGNNYFVTGVIGSRNIYKQNKKSRGQATCQNEGWIRGESFARKENWDFINSVISNGGFDQYKCSTK